jgi:putative ABC transport system permease protein
MRWKWGVDRMTEAGWRGSRGASWVESAIADLRFSARTLGRSPAFAIAAIATLALGIGANTAIFSVLNAVFLRPLPYAHPERLVAATEYFPNFKREQMFVPEFAAWRGQSAAFERLEAYGIPIGVNLAAGDRPARRVRAGHVTPGFFAMLGVPPQIGRWFAPDEDQPGRNRAALLSDALWREYFGADSRIAGQPISLDGQPFTAIGVMPAGFVDPGAADTALWLPDAVDARSSLPGRAMRFLGGAIGRLEPGATAEGARASLEVAARRMDGQYPAPWSRYHAAAGVRVVPLQERLTAGAGVVIPILMGAVGFILLIACANVANMFLSRAVAREKEMALRAAIGASRSRLLRLLLAESLLVAACGGLAGMVLMRWGVPALGFLLPDAIPPHVPMDARVLGFAAFCSLAASVLSGLAPALAVSKPDLNAGLKDFGARAGRRRGRFGMRGGLAAAQIALSLVLLTGAGLLLRSFLALIRVDPGFDARNVLLAEVSLAPHDLYGPARQAQFFGRALEAIRRIPGVEYAAVTDESPLSTFQSLAAGMAGEGQPPVSAPVVPVSASADYFRALRIPLLEGRFFDGRDGAGGGRVAIVNRTLAGLLFPGLDPVGRRIHSGDGPDPWITVVGVVGDIRHRGLDDRFWPELYQPFAQSPAPWMSFVVRTSADPMGLVPAARAAVAGIDRSQPLFDVQSLAGRTSQSVAQRRQRAFLLAAFAALALAIAVVGVYGVMACSVERRTHEMGVRIALGARPRAIFRMVLAEGMRMALLGMAAGLAGAIALTRVLEGFLFGVKPTDAATFIAVCLLLISAAGLAAYIPARRATRVDPMVALRHE